MNKNLNISRRDIFSRKGLLVLLVATTAEARSSDASASAPPADESKAMGVTSTPQQVSITKNIGGEEVACDWRGPHSGGARRRRRGHRHGLWSMTSREFGSIRWDSDGDRFPDNKDGSLGKNGRLNKVGRLMLLERFKLEDVAARLTRDVIELMSPADLASERRALEKKLGFPRHEMKVRTVSGEYLDAELCS